MEAFDVVIIGAGMAGASLAWALAPQRRVLLLEQESQPGYHSTGRSAATLHRSYGNRTIRALTAASAPFYLDPPAGFSASRLWRERAVLKVAREDQRAELAENLENTLRFVPEALPLDRQQCLDLLPALRPDYVAAGLLDPTMLDLDVAAILAGYLKGARAGAVELRTSAVVEAIRPDRGAWEVIWRGGAARAAVLVDAAGAWADSVAGLAGLEPLGIVPHRRTAVIVPAPTGVATADWPMVEAIGETWYLKPDAGRLLCSPADETACAPAMSSPRSSTSPFASTASSRPSHSRFGGSSAAGPGCAASLPTARRSSASTHGPRASSGWPARAAMASRPHRHWQRSPRR